MNAENQLKYSGVIIRSEAIQQLAIESANL